MGGRSVFELEEYGEKVRVLQYVQASTRNFKDGDAPEKKAGF